MKKVLVVVATILLASVNVTADTARPANSIRLAVSSHSAALEFTENGFVDSVVRVRGVFRVFGDDDDTSTGQKASQPRRKSRRSTKARRSSEPQKSRCNCPSQPQPDGILILLDGISPAF